MRLKNVLIAVNDMDKAIGFICLASNLKSRWKCNSVRGTGAAGCKDMEEIFGKRADSQE